jgi:PAS domain S-box-containing protein
MSILQWVGEARMDGSPNWARYVASGLITLLSLAIVTVLWRELRAITDPGLILLFTVAVSTYLAGGMAGMLSAAIVLICSFVLFSHPLYPFRYSDLDWRQMMAVSIASPLIALMVGSLKEQVDRLKLVTVEAEELREENRRLQFSRESQQICEHRFRMLAESLPDYAICLLDSGGRVMGWNPAAERVLGYSEPEIRGQSYSRFFTREDLLARRPERLLSLAHFSGRAEGEGWLVRKGGGRFRSTFTVVAMKGLQGLPGGSLMVARDLTEISDIQDELKKAWVQIEALKAGHGRGS